MEKHLEENEIAACLDALRVDRYEELPREILDHVEECLECKRKIVGAWEIIREGQPS